MNRPLPRTIAEYLDDLRTALRGADPALIQDALYDAEDHLRSELAENPGKSEAEVLAKIATTYGAPDEVAGIYVDKEQVMQQALRPPPQPPRKTAMGRFFGVAADPLLPKIVTLDMMGTDGAVYAALNRVLTRRGSEPAVFGQWQRPRLASLLDGKAYLEAALSSSTRKKLRQHRRKLSEKGSLTTVIASEPEMVRRAVEDFLAMEASGWKGREGTALMSNAADAAFMREAMVEVTDRRERVLYMEGEPRFEAKFVRRAVTDDPNLAVTILQRTAEDKYLRLDVGSPDEVVGGFPKTRDELFGYRAIILGSVEAASFTPDQLRMLADFVSKRGGGLLMLGGRRSNTSMPVVSSPSVSTSPASNSVSKSSGLLTAMTGVTSCRLM